MPHLQNRFWYLILVLSLLLIGSTWIFISEGRLYPSTHYGKLYEANVLWLAEGSEVKQEFMARYPGLNQVDIFVKRRNSANNEAALTFYLRQTCQDQNNLNTQVVTHPYGEIDGQIYYTFSFSPLNESMGQKYCFILKSNAPSDDENLVGVLASNADVYSGGEALYEHPLPIKISSDNDPTVLTPQPNFSAEHKLFLPIIHVAPPTYNDIDAAFQLHYNSSRLEIANNFLMHLVEHKPYFWGDPGFYLLLLIVYSLGVSILIGLVFYKSH